VLSTSALTFDSVKQETWIFFWKVGTYKVTNDLSVSCGRQWHHMSYLFTHSNW